MASSNGITNVAPNQTASPVDSVPLASPDLSIVIPTYNEKAVIGDVCFPSVEVARRSWISAICNVGHHGFYYSWRAWCP